VNRAYFYPAKESIAFFMKNIGEIFKISIINMVNSRLLNRKGRSRALTSGSIWPIPTPEKPPA
jgi:hypothetical protein